MSDTEPNPYRYVKVDDEANARIIEVKRQAEERLGFTSADYEHFGRNAMLRVREFHSRPGVFEIQVCRSPDSMTIELYEYDPKGGPINVTDL